MLFLNYLHKLICLMSLKIFDIYACFSSARQPLVYGCVSCVLFNAV